MTTRKPKRPRDPAQLGKLMIDIATGEVADEKPPEGPSIAARRRGGKTGGKARALSLTAEQREDIARVAARARWKK